MRHDDRELDVELELDDEGGSSLAPFLLGVMVGAGAALLLAPRAGTETRRELARLLGGAGERREGAALQGSGARAGGWMDRARGAVETQVDRVRDAVEEGREAARQAGEELRRTLGEAKEAYRAGVAGTPPPKPAARPRAVPASGAPEADGAGGAAG